MRTKTLLCRLRKLHTSRLLHGAPQPGPSDLMAARPGSNMLTSQRGISRGADAGARSALFGEYHVRANATGSRDNHISTSLGSVRFMGVGSLKEGNRAGQHGAKYPQGKPDGSPEKAEVCTSFFHHLLCSKTHPLVATLVAILVAKSKIAEHLFY
jgi:hypothetical protein